MVDTGKVKQFIICVKNEKKPIGSVYLRDISQLNRSAEFGIFIGEEEYLGKGFGSDAATTIIKYAFETLKLHKLRLRVLAGNKRAIASYKRVGFVEEGYFKDDVMIQNRYCDVIFMRILENGS
jgi:diamine N-acetyltransferase